MVNFGGRLRALRKEKGLTQEQLAARLGVTKSVVSAYENSLRYPSYDILIRIASIFHVSTDYLLGVREERLRNIDITDLSSENARLVCQLVEALKDKGQDAQ